MRRKIANITAQKERKQERRKARQRKKEKKKERQKISIEGRECREHQGQNRRTRTAISAHYSFLLKPQPDLVQYKWQQHFPWDCNAV